MAKLRFLSLLIAISFIGQMAHCCPFASYKRGAFQKKQIASICPKKNSKEIVGHFQKRYDLALSEMRQQIPYDQAQLKKRIRTLEGFLKSAESYAERKAIKKTARCLKLVAYADFKSSMVGKERYKHLIEMMRVAIDNKNNAHWNDPEMKRFVSAQLEQLAYSHFMVNFNHTEIGYQYFWEVMPKELTALDTKEINAKLINRMMNKVFPNQSPSVFFSKLNRKLHAPFFASWDGALSTLRSKIATYHWQGRDVSLVRMSSPVYGKNYRLTIDPIFTEYLSALKSRNKRHLYISNLDTTGSTHAKTYRVSEAMLALSRKPEYRDAFDFVVLPFESSFYKQGNLGLLRASYFKETFLNSMLLKQEGFYFSSKLLTNSEFISFISSMLDEIHDAFFENREFLERVERCQFIDIAYAHITKYLIEQNEINMFSWGGLDSIDHPMTAIAVFDVLLQTISPDPIHLDSTLYISLWPAMLYHHRHPETNCTVRGYSAIQKLLEDHKQPAFIKETEDSVQDLAL